MNKRASAPAFRLVSGLEKVKLRRCPLCDQIFPVEKTMRRCPTEQCTSIPEMWVRPEDPLVSDAALRSWEKMSLRIQRRRERPGLAA